MKQLMLYLQVPWFRGLHAHLLLDDLSLNPSEVGSFLDTMLFKKDKNTYTEAGVDPQVQKDRKHLQR